MTDLPQFVEDQSACSAADHSRHLADPTYKPTNPAWQEARDRALVSAGFAADPGPGKPLDEMSDDEVDALSPAAYFDLLKRRDST